MDLISVIRILFLAVIMLGLLGILIKIYTHLSILTALPTYTAIITIELIAACSAEILRFGKKAPAFLRFNKPTSRKREFAMNFFATFSTLGGYLVVSSQYFNRPILFLEQYANGAIVSNVVVVFSLVCVFSVYIMSFIEVDKDDSDPFDKLYNLAVPQTLKAFIDR